MIYTHDHAPAHVHLVGPDGRAKIALNCPGGPVVLVEARGSIDEGTPRRALTQIEQALSTLCEDWRLIHGTC
ncbi:DUF4160 domain-containing protein [Propionivibrio sp.]|uniref:DUF4160 domain-containing protein n=1 Tax=Propionivibrio sp. TaxID=2212460 RepID=UPI003BF07193